MDKAIAKLNIEHFRKKLTQDLDEAARQTIRRLLAEEEAKLAALEGHATKEKDSREALSFRPSSHPWGWGRRSLGHGLPGSGTALPRASVL